ncbi:MAG: hypothetical protein PWQ97_465 [Tepidanaerobacteraceae bacterium]|nr:hypothetical protein [Tepidanaerobacteraceae bacterium]
MTGEVLQLCYRSIIRYINNDAEESIKLARMAQAKDESGRLMVTILEILIFKRMEIPEVSKYDGDNKRCAGA